MNLATVNATQWPAASRFMVKYQTAEGIAGMYFREPDQKFFYSLDEQQRWIKTQREQAQAKGHRMTITEFERAWDDRAVVTNCNLF